MDANQQDKLVTFVATLIGVVAVAVIVACVLALPVMFLWNAIIPDITKNALEPIGFWQALALNVLCCILFKSSSSSKKG
jgi:hypothetical protein